MLNRIIQSLSKSQLLYPKNRVEMGGGHDNSAFIPHHIFGVSQIPNTPATEIYCTGWNQGSACAWTYPFLLHSISALRFFHSRTFYPLKPLLSTGKMLSHYDTHTVPSSECRRERLLTKLIIQSSVPAQLQEMGTQKVSVFTALKSTITAFSFWHVHVSTSWLTPVTRKAALQRRP